MNYQLLKKMMLFVHPHPMPRPRAYAHEKGYATVTSPMGELNHIKQELKLYRQNVEDAFVGPLRIDMIFGIQSPNNGKYKAPIGRTSGDLDNHAKGILDLMQQKGINIIVDDKAVVELNTMKIYSDGPFIYIAVYKTEPDNDIIEKLIFSLVEGESWSGELNKKVQEIINHKGFKNEKTSTTVMDASSFDGLRGESPISNELHKPEIELPKVELVKDRPPTVLRPEIDSKKNEAKPIGNALSFLLSRSVRKE